MRFFFSTYHRKACQREVCKRADRPTTLPSSAHGSCTELAKKVCPRLHDSACWHSGEITQPRTNFFVQLCSIRRIFYSDRFPISEQAESVTVSARKGREQNVYREKTMRRHWRRLQSVGSPPCSVRCGAIELFRFRTARKASTQMTLFLPLSGFRYAKVDRRPNLKLQE